MKRLKKISKNCLHSILTLFYKITGFYLTWQVTCYEIKLFYKNPIIGILYLIDNFFESILYTTIGTRKISNYDKILRIEHLKYLIQTAKNEKERSN